MHNRRSSKSLVLRFPFFLKTKLKTGDEKEVELIDGGYCANNPTLYAIADAVVALRKPYDQLRVLSVGVGVYPKPKKWSTPQDWIGLLVEGVLGFTALELLQKTLNINTESMEQLRRVLFKDIKTIRVNDTFERPEMATDLLESDLSKLNVLYQRGGESFAHHEAALRELLDVWDE